MTTTASIEPLLERLLGGQPLSADQRGALVASKDLLALGMAPGPQMGEVLRAVYELQLDGAVKTVEEAVAEGRKRL